MSQDAASRYVAALTAGAGLHDEFIYSMPFDDYRAFPDPFPRRAFTVREVEARIERYPESGEARRIISMGHSRQTSRTGGDVDPGHGRRHDPRRRRE